MNVFYFDNFRGFSNTFLPLANVNFFVGENSTGKTSVLKLIKILSDAKFWFTEDFNLEDVDLGYYSEMASNTNKIKNHFDVGVLSFKKGDEDGFAAVKLRFVNKEGSPSISEMSLVMNETNIQLVLDGEKLKFKYEFLNFQGFSTQAKIDYFKKWINKNSISGVFETALDGMSITINESFLFSAQKILSRVNRDDNKKYKNRMSPFRWPNFIQDIVWLAPIRTHPKRTYDSFRIKYNPDGTHAPMLLKKLIGKGNSLVNREKIKTILQKFGKESGLYDSIDIKTLGRDETSPFELQIIMNNHPVNITNVGYGVSQILPVITEIIAREDGVFFAIQQPEIHLHPRGQAAFGEFIFNASISEGKNFILETHSDYTIDRYRLKLKKIKSEIPNGYNSQVVFFNKKKGKNTIHVIPIHDDGTFSEYQPEEFRNFFIKEHLDLLEL